MSSTRSQRQRLVHLSTDLADAAGLGDWARDTSTFESHIDRAVEAWRTPLPRLHRRLRVPIDVAARMLSGADGDGLAYNGYLLPPSVQMLTSVNLRDPAVARLADELVREWRAFALTNAPPDVHPVLKEILEDSRWRTQVDPGDWAGGPAPGVRDGGIPTDPSVWDASARAALGSLPDDVAATDRLPLLIGLWSGALRTPRLPHEWRRAEDWIASKDHSIRTVDDLASARVWAMSSVSPLYRTAHRATAESFLAWAYRRASTWPAFTSIDPQIHRRLVEGQPTIAPSTAPLWPDWVVAAVSGNTLRSSVAAMTSLREPATAEELLGDLDTLIGLDDVKREIRRVVSLTRLEAAKAEEGRPSAALDLNMVFVGNPGTGKTTVARLYGKILRAAGALTNGVFVEVTRADLSGPHRSEATQRTRKALAAAEGGVLFIDEAYSLSRGGPGDGQEVIDELVAALDARRGRLAVVVAGYPAPMHRFLDANPGLRSRFREPIVFGDLSSPQLFDALVLLARRDGYRIAPDARGPILDWISSRPRGEGFGNVREMRTLLGTLKEGVAERYERDRDVVVDLITELDVPRGVPRQLDDARYRNAMASLDELSGLAPLKSVLQDFAFKALRAERVQKEGGRAAPPELGHMVFVGNPGTGKTTAARHVGAVLAAAGILRSGHVKVVGQADLIGEYLGQTAPKVRDAVRDARDGVLFIDEAYALTASGPRDVYVREALITLIDEMERQRDRLVVILAGYPEQMKQFLESNPGLVSRIRHRVEFPDFTRDELRQIALDMVSRQEMTLSPAAADAITDHAVALAERPGFANARTVRNLVDQATTRHAARVASPDVDGDLLTLTTIEVVDVPEIDLPVTRRVGFQANDS